VAAMSRRSRLLSYGSAALAVLAGALCAGLIDSLTGEVLAIAMITVGLGAIVLLVFFEVGLSEERDLERQRRRRP
jgi:NADH:ubiquinone oxidoreductase subunit 6 (subunit J)